MTKMRMGAASALVAILAVALPCPAPALDTLPTYDVVEIGSQLIAANANTSYSVALAVNESGDAVGWAIVNGMQTPFVYTAEHGPRLLPPLGIAAQAVDLTDRDVLNNILIVGTADPGTVDRSEAAVLWIYSTTSDSVTEAREIGALPGFLNSVAAAANNQWIVVGYSTNYDFSGSPAMAYDVNGNLLQSFDFPARPADINDFGMVTGGGFVGEIGGPAVDLGTPPDTSQPLMAAINDQGWVTGHVVTTISDGQGRMITAAVRYTDIGGWQVITANSALDTGHDINNPGDVVGNVGRLAQRPFLYIDALDATYYVDGLLAPAFSDRFVTVAAGINDAGQIVGSGTGGALLLTPAGTLLPPPPPADLTAIAHESTPAEPWYGITLTWTDTSNLETGFRIERSLSAADTWTVLASSWTGTVYWDKAVEAGVTYDYRVAAVGVAGTSGYSNIATATAPVPAPAPAPDVIAPTVSILSPASGSAVSGKLDIAVEAADDTALAQVEISTVVKSSKRVLCSWSAAGQTTFTATCRVNLRKVPSGSYRIDAAATDGAGNMGTDQITVNVVNAGKLARIN